MAGESPTAVVDDLLPRYRKVLFKQGTLSLENSRKLLMYPTLTELDQAYQSKKISASTYDMQKKLFLDIDRREHDMDMLADEEAQKKFKEIKK
jgi:hypothetical protein